MPKRKPQTPSFQLLKEKLDFIKFSGQCALSCYLDNNALSLHSFVLTINFIFIFSLFLPRSCYIFLDDMI